MEWSGARGGEEEEAAYKALTQQAAMLCLGKALLHVQACMHARAKGQACGGPLSGCSS